MPDASPLSVIEDSLSDGEFSRPLFVDPAAAVDHCGVEAASEEDCSLFFAWKAMTTAAESAMPAVT